jgi:serine/threonine protein kinase
MDALPESHKPALCLIMPKYDCSLTDYAASVDQSPQHRTGAPQIDGERNLRVQIRARFVIHRDVKPDNMVKDGILYLIDFGLSQIFVDEHNDRIPQKYGETITGRFS